MYRVYCDGLTLYNSNLESLKIFNPSLELELNKTGSFLFTVYPDHPQYSAIQKLRSIITVYQDDYLVFRGRVLDDDAGFYNEKSIVCEGELAFLLDSVQRPYDYSGTIAGYLNLLIDNHNAQVEQSKWFTVGNVTVTDANDYIVRSNIDYVNTWDELQKKLIDLLGGYIVIRHDGYINYIDYLQDFTLLDFNASGKGLAFGKVSELTNGMEIDLDMSIYRNIFMGGSKRSDDEKNMYFQATDAAQYPHNCKLYGGNGASATSIGCWDSARSHGIWRYLSNTQNLVFDANVRVTRGNGGDEFVTSDPVVHGNRTGRVHFSNGLLIQWGTESITPVANTPTAKTVKFPVAYTDAPVVLTTAQTTVLGTIVSGDAAASITTTGFDCYVTRNSTTNTSVGWVAIGYKA